MRLVIGFCLALFAAQCCAADITVLSFRCDKTSWGAARLIGEVENTSGRTVRHLRIVANFRDSQNRLIESADGFGDIRPLMPGQSSGFDAVGPENPLYAKCEIAGIFEGYGAKLTYAVKPEPPRDPVPVYKERVFYKCPDAAGTIVIQERPCS